MYQQMVGYTGDELRNMRFTDLTHPDDVARDWNRFAELISGKRDRYRGDKRYFRRDGSLILGNVTVSLVRDDRGEPLFAIVMVEDITEQKRAEEALREAQAELAHVSRVMTMGELATSIAHEVNQPLTAVVANGHACLRWLGHATPDLEEVRAAVQRIIRDGKRGSEVIKRIRALAKKTDPQKVSVDVNDAIDEVAALVQSEARKHGLSLQTKLAPALPPVHGDRVQLEQVILNLTMNAIEASVAVTGRPRELVIRSQQDAAGAVLVAVQDAGIGLQPAHATRIFEAFFTTKAGGIGMGLSISRSIIEAHGGRLWATPNPGPGATFQFVLPAAS
jgi:PAS domain S-box-containing protein